MLDDRVASVATINSRIDDQGQITGVSRDEMLEQVVTLKSGALPADLEYVEDRTVGASLGEASIRSGVLASAGGLALVVAVHARLLPAAGLNALVSIVVNLLILVALVAFIPVTMTLPGIAGLILTIGMGVDSNVLIFERIKEELARARTAAAGRRRRFRPRLDHHRRHARHVAHRGGLPVSVRHQSDPRICDHVDARPGGQRLHRGVRVEDAVRDARCGGTRTGPQSAGLLRRRTRFDRTPDQVQPLGMACPARCRSLVIGAGVAAMATRGFPLGIDFAGGTPAVVEFAQPGVTEDDVRQAVAPLPGDESVQRYGPAGDRRFMIRLPLVRR